MSNVKNLSAASPQASGGVLIGDESSTIPTDAVAALTGFKAAGYINEDGLSESLKRDGEDIKVWGGSKVRVLNKSVEKSFKLSFLEAGNPIVLEIVYGTENVEIDDVENSYVVKTSTGELPEKVFVFDMIDNGTKQVNRIVVPRGKVTDIGDIKYTHGALTEYEVTIECLEDENGNLAYLYVKNPD